MVSTVGLFPSFGIEGKISRPFSRNEQTLVEEIPKFSR